MVDLRSDTVTKPTKQMRDAMYHAEVGDDVYGEDPTVNQLEVLAAEVLGKEAALFVTSGTQGNQIAVLTYTRPSEEIILEADSHLFYYEGGAVSGLAGVQTRTLHGKKGQIPIHELEAAIRGVDIHVPKTSLICLENTHNRGGGVVLPLSYMELVGDVSKRYGIPVHMDGARLWNAAVALGVEVSELTKHTDSVQVCLSKGLCAPMGSILAGPKDFIDEARYWRKRLGGGMRQAGLMAAPGIIAITEMVQRLEEDHNRAKSLAKKLTEVEGFTIQLAEVETNIILVDTKQSGLTAAEVLSILKDKYQILANSFGPYTVRLMTHREIEEEHVLKTIEAFKGIRAT
ncbi:threonine aldolase family protein [Bacillus horti]|uniref:Threonine aldolase n=1 Tax=Caldalkalibacillus horti TaxID=77523 RepID=A0ABT9W021_9BACI|nr:GntG family PLP-dependent aldolase [Bacillus horti]MDQ0166599.1 threonine aldolase [Bacillus horti]